MFLFTLISRPSPYFLTWQHAPVLFRSLNAVAPLPTPLLPPKQILAHRAKVRPRIEPRLSLSLFLSPLLPPSLSPSVCLTPVLSHCILCLKIYSVMLQTCICTHSLRHLSSPVSDDPLYSVCFAPLAPNGGLPSYFMSSSFSPLQKRL